MKKNTKAREDIYTLHIDAEPEDLSVKPVSSASQVVVPSAKKIHHIPGPVQHAAKQSEEPEPVRRKRGLWSKIWDKLEFFVVAGGVFTVIYVVLNWGAIWVNIEHYWDVYRGYESPLQALAQKKDETADALLTTAHAEGSIPPLNLEVYPPDMRVVIPRINKNVPVVGVKNENLIARRWDQLESDIQGALRNGVVHYPGTALPGDNGNVVITGHSSYYTWDPGRFKDVFALLHDVHKNDRIVVYFNQQKFVYEVDAISVVLPSQVDVLAQSASERLTLITCTPIGTNLKRLVIGARLIEKD